MTEEGNDTKAEERVYSEDQKRQMILGNLGVIAQKVKTMEGGELHKTLSSLQAISGLGPSTPVSDQSEDIIQIIQIN